MGVWQAWVVAWRTWAFWRSQLLTLLLLLAVVLAVQWWQTRDIPPQPPNPEQPWPLVQVGAPSSTLKLSDWRAAHPGKVLALHVWADWCPICRAEEASVTRVQTDWPVMTIAMRSGDAAQVEKVMRQRGLSWPAWVDERGVWAQQLGVGAVPAFLVLDAQGQIRASSVGYTTEWGMLLRLWWVRLVY